MEKRNKTIFILINRSFLIRNILRSGTLELLKKKRYNIVIFFAAPVPQYLRDEFEDDQVKLHGFEVSRTGRLRRLFNKTKRYVIVTRNTKYSAKYIKLLENNGLPNKERIISRKKKPTHRIYIELAIAYILSAIPPLKFFIRWGEPFFFPEHSKRLKDYFDTYKPDLIFSTSTGGTFEYPFIKEARRRSVKTLSIPKSWDNINNEFIPLVPDRLVVQNHASRKSAEDIQKIPRDRISVVGMPHFDWYKKKEILKSRKEHLESKGLDPDRALIFFGSEGIWAPNDHLIAEKLQESIEKDEFVKPCQLLVRPHYSNVREDVFKNLRGKSYVSVDSFRIVDFLIDKWDQSLDETIDFVNSVAHCDMMISIASSLSLDAAAMNKPSISPGFWGEYAGGKDVTGSKLYSTDHVHWLMSSGGVWKVDSYDELKKAINAYLENPKLHEEERKRTIEKLCYKLDGKASERLVEVIESMFV
ncbi:MAG: hypothetical protein QF858_03450 [Candidatus Pacebacteria bacterium]|jgi:hypothetical protein|nr:hypothetical protein [bacterium]MDP6527904.1 hypothetical protein [Candidatus Paceibacterota bacterium]MDP6659714.1 hypothetical protein [Candidatus Paceibacterota bacterium]|tara:strand:- start:12817 stop:14232 length:1416 start_codon:yes stop_codon:yes gene_type:complete